MWLGAPLVAAFSVRPALDTVESPFDLVIETALWLGWFVGAVGLLVPHPVSLTVIRVLAPTVAGTAVLLGLSAGWSGPVGLLIAYGLLVTAISLLPAVGDIMVNGSAYGAERRMALRPPAIAVAGAVPVIWLAMFFGLTSWALLLAGGRRMPAVVAALVGVAVVWASIRVLHQFSRRWIVFVPAGFVIHDPFQLAEPVLLARTVVRRLGPAEVEPGLGDRLDLSAGALGLALEVETSQPVTFGTRHRRTLIPKPTSRMVFSPTLPGGLLAEARIRGIKIRASSGVDEDSKSPGSPSAAPTDSTD